MKLSRVFLSVFIITHLWLVLVIPFQSPVLRQALPSVFYSYMTSIGLNTPWNFFSPDPAPEIFFEIETYEDKYGEEDWKSSVWPPKRGDYFFRETFYRRLFSTKALMLTEDRWKILARYFCRAQQISLVTLKLKSYPSLSILEEEDKKLQFHGERQFLCEDLK